jgi:hypothetical protein
MAWARRLLNLSQNGVTLPFQTFFFFFFFKAFEFFLLERIKESHVGFFGCFFFIRNLGRNMWGYKKHIIEPHTSTMRNGRNGMKGKRKRGKEGREGTRERLEETQPLNI